MGKGNVLKYPDRFWIRDIDTKDLLIRFDKPVKFNSLNAAKIYYQGMNYGLNQFYEIFDSLTQKVVDKDYRLDPSKNPTKKKRSLW